jgi:hypothetical protein
LASHITGQVEQREVLVHQPSDRLHAATARVLTHADAPSSCGPTKQPATPPVHARGS